MKLSLLDNRAFTLLEVMIALAILAIAMTSLFGSQSSSLSLAIEGKFNTLAAFLAQEKLAEYEAGLLEVTSSEGDFGAGYTGFTWKTEVEEADVPMLANMGRLKTPLLRIELTVAWEDEQYSVTFVDYVRGRER